MKNIGIILAGGSGHRMGNHTPKQFLLLGGKTILEHTLAVFQQNQYIDEIIIITNSHYIQKTEALLATDSYSKVTHVLAGGQERYHSTLAALKACSETDCNLIIHDAVRPLVSDSIITACVKALETFQACTTAIPTTDTILMCDPSHTHVANIPDRNVLYNVQTPQAFRKSTLVQAYEKGISDSTFHPTDDCGVVCKYLPEIKIQIVSGHSSNFKITYPEDLITAEKLLSGHLK